MSNDDITGPLSDAESIIQVIANSRRITEKARSIIMPQLEVLSAFIRILETEYCDPIGKMIFDYMEPMRYLAEMGQEEGDMEIHELTVFSTAMGIIDKQFEELGISATD